MAEASSRGKIYSYKGFVVGVLAVEVVGHSTFSPSQHRLRRENFELQIRIGGLIFIRKNPSHVTPLLETQLSCIRSAM